MNRSNVGHFHDASGVVDNDTDPLGGALNLSSPIADEEDGGLFDSIPIPASGDGDQAYYATAGIAIAADATGTLQNPSLYNRAGMRGNASAGVVEVVSTSALDTGTLVSTGKEDAGSSTWDQDSVPVTGTTQARGTVPMDIDTIQRAEYTVGGVLSKPVGNLTISIQGEIVAVIPGTGLPADEDAGRGNTMASREFRLAVARDKNTELGWSGSNNRRTPPDLNVGAFGQATRWADGDASLPVASDMVANDEIHYVAEFIAHEGIPLPVGGGSLVLDVDLVGTGVG